MTDGLGSLTSRFARQYMCGGKAAGRGSDDFIFGRIASVTMLRLIRFMTTAIVRP